MGSIDITIRHDQQSGDQSLSSNVEDSALGRAAVFDVLQSALRRQLLSIDPEGSEAFDAHLMAARHLFTRRLPQGPAARIIGAHLAAKANGS